MRYQQLRILAFMVGVLVHQIETTDFECNNEFLGDQLACVGTIHGEDFNFGTAWGCTLDGEYCAQLSTPSSADWTISVLNYGMCDPSPCTPGVCSLDCPTYTDESGGTSCDVTGC
jgi:hypothetical protein